MPDTQPNLKNIGPIRHVVVLMLENRSFDHLLGGLASDIPKLDGTNPEHSNRDYAGKKYFQQEGADPDFRYDPSHELEHVLNQIADGNAGFVKDFQHANPLAGKSNRAEIMKYFKAGTLPALHALANDYGVCNRWFSSVPGPTWANRLFMHSGTSKGIVSMPNGIMDANLHWYDQTTIYDRLNEKNISWRIYYGDVPQSLILVNQWEPHNARNYCKMQRFYQDAAGEEKDFPQYCFIEPAYYLPGASDGHPPHDVREADKLVAEVYNALRRNKTLWSSTLMIVLCDEHGGFYDHVEPPEAIPPDHYLREYTFDRYGVRVPAILASPHVSRKVIEEQFDHTSILKYLIEGWELGPLGRRTEAAKSIAPFIDEAVRDDADDLPVLPLPAADPKNDDTNRYGRITGRSQPALSGHQSALVAMTQLLESMSDVAGTDLLSRLKRLVTGFDGVVDVAMERVEDFLWQRKAAANGDGKNGHFAQTRQP